MISLRAALYGLVDRPEPESTELTDASSRTVTRHVIALLILSCGLPLISEALVSGSLYGLPSTWPTRVGYMFFWAQFAVAAVVFGWLSWLVIARTPLSRVAPGQRLVQRGAAVFAGAAAMFGTAPFPSAFARLVGQTALPCGLAWLALELCRAHGVSLRITLPRTPVERLRDWEITWLVFLACLAGGVASFLLLHLIRWTGIDVPS
ncbi:hypothetical protein OG496_00860 [Streptomyces sp. NBC_00988]|uniref:hypothetical protein n=1 Tax=Streptomyces sp. NBC_00988 TaxID=2903704 RepID=UPI00386805B9|nr:hypothetical protein OG496_00860 [Streptomyces sp. NBC_00988]